MPQSANPALQLILKLNREAIQAVAGILWRLPAGQPGECLGFWGFGNQKISQLQQQWQGNDVLLQQVQRTAQPARASATATTETGAARQYEIVVYPLFSREFSGVVQFFFADRKQADQFLQRGLTPQEREQLQRACQTTTQEPLHSVSAEQSGQTLSSLPDWIAQVEKIVRETAPHEQTALLNQICLQYEFDRCSLYTGSARRIVGLAVSGATSVDSRSATLQDLKELVQRQLLSAPSAEITSHPLSFPQREGEPTKQFWLYPLQSTSNIASRGAVSQPLYLLVESFSAVASPENLDRFSEDLPVWTLAFQAVSRQRPQRHLSDGRGLRNWAVGVMAVGVLLAMPFPLRISAPGQYVPQERVHIFSPEAGVIAADDLQLPSDGMVKSGQTLLSITSRPLDLEISQVEGQTATTAEQIRSLRSTRSERDNSAATRPTAQTDISIQLAELTARLTGLQQELALLQERKQSLQVTSPLAGEVLTWEPEQTLAGRPVSRGQLLLTIGNVSAGWEVQADVRDQDLGYFKLGVQAQKNRVQLQPHSPQQRSGSGEVTLISPAVRELNPGQFTAQVQIRVEPAKQNESPPVPGSRVTVLVTAGYYPAGYVWFRGLIDAARQFFVW